MRPSTSLSLFFALTALFHSSVASSVSLTPRQGNQRNRNGNNNGGGNNGNNGNGNNGNNNAGGDPQTSLTLDPRVVATAFAKDGQDVPTAGQVPSLTSTNNFINFCLTAPNLPITNGQQITSGSCNPTPIGAIPSIDNMPSSKFTFPVNGGTIPANQKFTISMAIRNLQTGSFTNAQQTYFAAPQQLNGQGTIIGHSHVVVERLDSLDQTTPTNPKVFAFFKGLNAAAQNGVLTADVESGLPAAAYRLCSINAAANHQPVIAPVAQHGSLDDCIYFTATNGNGNNNAGGGNASGNNGAGNANGQNNNGQGNNGQGNNGQGNNGQGNNGQGNNGQGNNGQGNNGQGNNGQNGQGNNRGNGGFGGRRGSGGFGGRGRFGGGGRGR